MIASCRIRAGRPNRHQEPRAGRGRPEFVEGRAEAAGRGGSMLAIALVVAAQIVNAQSQQTPSGGPPRDARPPAVTGTAAIRGRIFAADTGRPLRRARGAGSATAGGPGGLADDAGQFRVRGLPPGTYYLRATMRDTWTVSENGVEQTYGYAPSYYPNTTNIGDARRLTVGIGQEASNNDIALIPGRAVSVSGTAFDSHGRPLAGQSVSLTQETRGPGMGMFMSAGSGNVKPDGTFTIKSVPPGEFKLMARASGERGTEAATLPILVNGVDLDNISLVTSSGGSITGQIVADTGGAPAVARDRVRVMARLADGDYDPRMGGPAAASPDYGR